MRVKCQMILCPKTASDIMYFVLLKCQLPDDQCPMSKACSTVQCLDPFVQQIKFCVNFNEFQPMSIRIKEQILVCSALFRHLPFIIESTCQCIAD